LADCARPIKSLKKQVVGAPNLSMVVERELAQVCRTLRRQGLSVADAEDVSQEVFLTMWRRWSDYDPRRPLRAWLAGMALRTAYRFTGRQGREVPRGFIVDAPDDQPTPEDHASEASERTLVLEVLSELSERERTVLQARDVDGVPMQDIAGRLGIPLQTAYTRLRSGRRNFSRLLRRRSVVADAKAALVALQSPE
jgi:RNA polymerase sigma-70 factor (ECF subfamily)